MKKQIMLLVALLSIPASADGLKIETTGKEYVSKTITARHIKGIELTLTTTALRHDCNSVSMYVEKTLVRGSGEGWYDSYFFDADVMYTRVGCDPLPKPVRETVTSETYFFKSLSNAAVDNAVAITVIVPKNYAVNVKEVP